MNKWLNDEMTKSEMVQLYNLCVPQKRKPINRVNFSENCNDLSEKAYIYTKFSLSFLLTPVTKCSGHAWTSTDHFKWWCQKWFAQNGNLRGKRGLPSFRTKGRVERHSLVFLLSLLSCFFCLDSIFWHGLASLNLAISTQHKLHNYSAQIVFDMHEFELFLFIHALIYHYVFGIKWKRRKCSWQWII